MVFASSAAPTPTGATVILDESESQQLQSLGYVVAGGEAAAEASLAAIDNAIQVHGGNGMSEEYGIAALWGLARTMRIAPVSREMILNFVAQHSLGLPKSY